MHNSENTTCLLIHLPVDYKPRVAVEMVDLGGVFNGFPHDQNYGITCLPIILVYMVYRHKNSKWRPKREIVLFISALTN